MSAEPRLNALSHEQLVALLVEVIA